MRRHLPSLVAAVSLLFASATVSTQSAPARAAQPQASVTFAETIAPIVFQQCSSCHRPGEAAPFALLSYEDVAKRGALIAQVTGSRYMPPWHADDSYGEFVGERRLSDAQIAAIAAWVKNGMLRGDMSRMPAVPAFPAEGWRLGQPDLVLEMPAFDVPAGGPDLFRNFVIPTRVPEDKWVRAVEYRPSARSVVHHAIFAQVPGGSLASRDGADGRPGFGGLSAVGVFNNGQDSRGLGGWAVGATPQFMPEGTAVKLPKDADFLLQLHLHPTGKPERERSLIGLYFADEAPERELIDIAVPAFFGAGAGIDIPPGEKAYTIRESFTLPADVRVYTAAAHAHYLATRMNATAHLPDGSQRTLLSIRDWNFNWQDSYVYKQPFVLPKGTRIDATITYDNSADNPRNPVSPPRRVLFGEQSFDEMGGIGFSVEVLDKGDMPAVQKALGDQAQATLAAAKQNGTWNRFIIRAMLERRGLQQLTILDRAGTVVGRVGDPGLYAQATFSPDGSRIAVAKTDPDVNTPDIWTFDVATGRGRAITDDPAADSSPVWSPDSTQLAYVSARGGAGRGVYRRSLTGAESEELLYRHPNATDVIILTDWSADNRFLTFWVGDSMFLLPLTGERTVIPLDPQAFRGRGGRLSPDGRFLAYNSNHTGQFQVYVRPITAGGAPAGEATQVSAGGVGGIFWRRDGRELLYLGQPGQAVTSVEIDAAGTIKTDTRKSLFKLPTPILAVAQLSSIATADGERFVFAVNLPQRQAATPAAPAGN